MNPIEARRIGECIRIGLCVEPSATHLAEASTLAGGKTKVTKERALVGDRPLELLCSFPQEAVGTALKLLEEGLRHPMIVKINS